jgi:hypothetical protein
LARPFLFRVGIAQILANPAYADELVASIQEPTFPDGNEKVGLFSVAICIEALSEQTFPKERHVDSVDSAGQSTQLG